MNQFIQKHDEYVTGALGGWDRVVFRGYLRMLCFVDGMMGYLYPMAWLTNGWRQGFGACGALRRVGLPSV